MFVGALIAALGEVQILIQYVYYIYIVIYNTPILMISGVGYCLVLS